MSAFHLSGDNVFLEKAKDLGQRLMGAFSSSSGIPYSDVNLKSTRGHAPKWSPDSSKYVLAFSFTTSFYLILPLSIFLLCKTAFGIFKLQEIFEEFSEVRNDCFR